MLAAPGARTARHGTTLSPPTPQVLGWPPRVLAADRVVGALRQLLDSFQAQRAGGQGHGVVDPTPLRDALAAMPNSQFGVGARPHVSAADPHRSALACCSLRVAHLLAQVR